MYQQSFKWIFTEEYSDFTYMWAVFGIMVKERGLGTGLLLIQGSFLLGEVGWPEWTARWGLQSLLPDNIKPGSKSNQSERGRKGFNIIVATSRKLKLLKAWGCSNHPLGSAWGVSGWELSILTRAWILKKTWKKLIVAQAQMQISTAAWTQDTVLMCVCLGFITQNELTT